MLPKKRAQTAPPHHSSPLGKQRSFSPPEQQCDSHSRPMTSRLTKDHSETRMSFINGCQADQQRRISTREQTLNPDTYPDT
jgi:hypothetical protein